MGSVLSACVASCACTACCTLAGCSCYVSSLTASSANVFTILLASVLALGLRSKDEEYIRLPDSLLALCGADTCSGVFAVYRVTLALTAYFAALCLLTLVSGASTVGAKLHRGWWWAKAMLLVLLLTGTLFVSNEFLVGVREVMRYGSGLFLLVQVLGPLIPPP